MRISFLSVPFACAVLICLAFGLSPLAAQQSEISDQVISDRIHDELLFDHGVISSKIEVGSVDGVVTLRGEASTTASPP